GLPDHLVNVHATSCSEGHLRSKNMRSSASIDYSTAHPSSDYVSAPSSRSTKGHELRPAKSPGGRVRLVAAVGSTANRPTASCATCRSCCAVLARLLHLLEGSVGRFQVGAPSSALGRDADAWRPGRNGAESWQHPNLALGQTTPSDRVEGA